MLVNKNNKLSADYLPENLEVVRNRKKDKPNQLLLLEKTVHKNFLQMIKVAFEEAGYDIVCDSAYRTNEYQKFLYDEQIKSGKDPAFLALPGESEHHTGLCLDIAAYKNGEYYDDTENLEDEYNWLHKNCYRFGFILRYPLGKENITGYPYEPWHFRYVGISHATIIMNKKITLEEYLEEWYK